MLNHHIFDSCGGWKKAESMPHQVLGLTVTTYASAYKHFGVVCLQKISTDANVVADTGAQSALWSLQGFRRSGFNDIDLLPVRRTMRAANMGEIEI